MSNDTEYIVQVFIPAEHAEDEAYQSKKEAEAVIRHLKLMSPENRYEVAEVERE